MTSYTEGPRHRNIKPARRCALLDIAENQQLVSSNGADPDFSPVRAGAAPEGTAAPPEAPPAVGAPLLTPAEAEIANAMAEAAADKRGATIPPAKLAEGAKAAKGFP